METLLAFLCGGLISCALTIRVMLNEYQVTEKSKPAPAATEGNET